jgi:predicted mannosyl-3-phosphoglycerate phosphatase (HAD superfamily)
LIAIFQQAYGEITSIGLGDAVNDAPFLRVVDTAIVMPSPFASEVLRLTPGAILARFSGPQGWNDAILSATADGSRRLE